MVDAGGYGFEVLPKCHGRLIDADELLKDMIGIYDGWIKPKHNWISQEKMLKDAPTIIEADKEGADDDTMDSVWKCSKCVDFEICSKEAKVLGKTDGCEDFCLPPDEIDFP